MGSTGRRVLTWLLVLCAGLGAGRVSSSAQSQVTASPELMFIAIGDVRAGTMEHLVSYFRRKFQLAIKTLPALSFDEATLDRERRQVAADRLIQQIRFRHPRLGRDPRARVIAVTAYDMYDQSMRDRWAFSFSLRSPDRRFAVVSYARMDPKNLGQPFDEAVLLSRLRKMVAKNIGIMYYGLRASDDPRSVLFRNILGVNDLDRMTEEFNPRSP